MHWNQRTTCEEARKHEAASVDVDHIGMALLGHSAKLDGFAATVSRGKGRSVPGSFELARMRRSQ
jgi:hypothetical protein